MANETTIIDFDGVYKTVIRQLEQDLPGNLTYHTADHTQTVIDTVKLLALSEGIKEEEILILQTAALFHDAGFLYTYKKHEEASCSFARILLPEYGFNPLQIELICRLIMVTRLPQKPLSKLEALLCDADLHYVGTEDYESISNELFKEFKKHKLVKTKKEWQRKQLLFLSSHCFFTSSAQILYSEKKEENLKKTLANQHKESPFIQNIQDFVFLVAGVLMAGFGLKSFLLPNLFFDGGITGISMLIHELMHIPLPLTILVLNLPFIIFGYFSISKPFAYKAFTAVILLSIFLLFIPYPKLTSDKLLISIFGGVFLGIGVGLSMRAGGVLDGIEILALHTLKRTSFTIAEIIFAINICIFAAAAFQFGIQTALYSVLTYFVASRTIDYVIEGIQAHIGVTIISGESESIKHQLVNELDRGITVYKGKRGFLPGNFGISVDCEIIFTVVSRLEMRKLKDLIYETDPNAFVFANTIREVSGGIIMRKARH